MAGRAAKPTGWRRVGVGRELRAGGAVSTRRVALASITARLLWDGRPEAGRFIPGIAHFQSGVAALRRAGDAAAAGRLKEIDAALTAAEVAVNRWARGIAAFARDELGDAAPGPPGWADTEERRLRVRTGEAVRLAALIGAFDVTCAATAAVTAAARERRGVQSPPRRHRRLCPHDPPDSRPRARRGARLPGQAAGAGGADAARALACGYDFFSCAGAAAAVLNMVLTCRARPGVAARWSGVQAKCRVHARRETSGPFRSIPSGNLPRRARFAGGVLIGGKPSGPTQFGARAPGRHPEARRAVAHGDRRGQLDSGLVGGVGPVQGGVTRFSGRTSPVREGSDRVSHRCAGRIPNH